MQTLRYCAENNFLVSRPYIRNALLLYLQDTLLNTKNVLNVIYSSRQCNYMQVDPHKKNDYCELFLNVFLGKGVESVFLVSIF